MVTGEQQPRRGVVEDDVAPRVPGSIDDLEDIRSRDHGLGVPQPVVGYLPLMSARRDCSAMLLLQTPREFARTVRAQQRQWDVIGT